MLTLRDASSGAHMQFAVAAGSMVGIGFKLPPATGPFTCARVLVVGDLLRRVIEDIYSAQVLATVITNDASKAEEIWGSGLTLRPVVGTFATEDNAEAALGKPLNLMVAVAGTDDPPARRPPAIGVAPVRSLVPYPGAGPEAARLALTYANHNNQSNMTAPLLARSQAGLDRWRERVAEWSRYPSRPIPANWRHEVVAALDDDLDAARVLTMMSDLEQADDVEPGAKFEAFTYVDRVLAVDLVRYLGRTPG